MPWQDASALRRHIGNAALWLGAVCLCVGIVGCASSSLPSEHIAQIELPEDDAQPQLAHLPPVSSVAPPAEAAPESVSAPTTHAAEPAHFESSDSGPGTRPIPDALPAEGSPEIALAGLQATLPAPVEIEPPADEPLTELVATPHSLNELVNLAMANHPALTAALSRIQAAEGARLQAGLRPNPQLGYIGEEIGDGGEAGKQGIGFSQTFITGGKLGLARMTADGDVLVALQQAETIRRRISGDVSLGYYDALAAQRRVELAQEVVAISDKVVENIEQLLNAGFAVQADLLRAQVEAQSNRVRLSEAQARHEAAWRQLAAVVGQPYMGEGQLEGRLEDGPADPSSYTWDNLLARLQTQSPEVSAAAARIERARRALREACRAATPNINAQAAVLYDDVDDQWIANAGLSAPLLLFNRNQGNIVKAQAQLREAEADLSRIELDLHQRLATAFADYSAALQEAERYREQVLPLASRSRELIDRGFQEGEQTYLDFLAAQRTDFDSQFAYLDALRRLRRSEAILDSLLLTGGLSAAP